MMWQVDKLVLIMMWQVDKLVLIMMWQVNKLVLIMMWRGNYPKQKKGKKRKEKGEIFSLIMLLIWEEEGGFFAFFLKPQPQPTKLERKKREEEIKILGLKPIQGE